MSAVEDKLRSVSFRYLHVLEAVFYITVGILLCAAAAVAVFDAAMMLWQGIASGTLENYGLVMLDRVLLVLMLVEVLHTVRISIGSREFMSVQPFLMVGLIATIRRVLVITMHAAQLAEEAGETVQAATAFRHAMIELGLLGFLTIVFALAIHWLRRPQDNKVLTESTPFES